MKKKDLVVAIACSDIHLSLKPPVARSGEEDWLYAMARAFGEIKALQLEHGGCPVICGGDIFDKWNVSPELINWAIRCLPEMYAIPGNHDLPMHQSSLIKRSAYWTLVEAGRVHHLDKVTAKAGLLLFPFPFGGVGQKPTKFEKKTSICIAVTHEYLWVPGCSYQGADKAQRLGSRMKAFSPYHVVVVGDNHMGFLRKLKNGTHVLNCGTVFRRKSNEYDYRPAVGLIYESGKVVRHFLDTKDDVIEKTVGPVKEEDDTEIAEFVEELSTLQASCLNFVDALKQAMKRKKASKMAERILMEIINNG